VHEFLTYSQLRSNTHLGRELSREQLELFDSRGVRPPTSDQEALAALHRLEEEVPSEFPILVKDAELVTLAQRLSKMPTFEQLLDRLQSHPMATRTTRDLIEEVAALPASEGPSYDGLRVLWIDDNPEWIKDKIGMLQERGAHVATAPNLKIAREMLRLTLPDVIISDIMRDGDENAGLNDLEELQRGNEFSGPFIFYTSRLTPSRQKAAESLGVNITSSREALMEFLRRNKEKDADRQTT